MPPSSLAPDPARPVVDPRKLEKPTEKQWGDVLRYFEPKCRKMCDKVLSDDEAEGVLHEVFVHIIERISNNRIKDDTAFWKAMFHKAKQKKVDAIRKMRAQKRDIRKTRSLDELEEHEEPVVGNEASGDVTLCTNESIDVIRRGIAKLTKIHRGPAKDYLLMRLSQKEIAAKYGITLNYAGVILLRAGRDLSKFIRNIDPDLADRVNKYWSRRRTNGKKEKGK